VHDGALHSFLSKGGNGAEVPFDSSITGNFTVYEDRFKQFIAAICPQRKFRIFLNFCCSFLGFPTTFAIIFEVNIAAEQKNAYSVKIFLLCRSFYCLQLF